MCNPGFSTWPSCVGCGLGPCLLNVQYSTLSSLCAESGCKTCPCGCGRPYALTYSPTFGCSGELIRSCVPFPQIWNCLYTPASYTGKLNENYI